MNKFIKCLSAILCGVGALFAVSKVNAYTISSEYGYITLSTDNLADTSCFYTDSVINEDGSMRVLGGYNCFYKVPLTPTGTYTISFNNSSIITRDLAFYDINGNFLSINNGYNIVGFTLPSNVYYISFDFRNDLTDIMINRGISALPYEPYGKFIDINAYQKVISGYLTTAKNIYWSNTFANENYITSYPMYVNNDVNNDNYSAFSLIESINNSQLVLANFQPDVSSDISSNHIIVNGAGFGSCTYLFEDLSSINLVSFTTFQFNQNNSLTNASAFYFEYTYNNIVGSVNLTYGDLITKYDFNYGANNLFEHSFYQLIVDNLGYEPSVIPTITRFSYSYDSLSNTYGFGYFNMLNVNGYSQGYESGYSTASNDKQRVIDRLQDAYNSLQDAYNSLNTRFNSLQELYDSYINDNVTLDALIWNIATTPFETFKTIWDVDILGVNLGSLCVGLMFVGIALYIWRKFV